MRILRLLYQQPSFEFTIEGPSAFTPQTYSKVFGVVWCSWVEMRFAWCREAVPMYNTGPNPHHPPGKWNGYVVLIHDDQPGSVYISGDTQFIPEMKTNFGFGFRFARAFLCMNLPCETPDSPPLVGVALSFDHRLVVLGLTCHRTLLVGVAFLPCRPLLV